MKITVPKDQYDRYVKYLPAQWRFTDTRLADQGIENTKFKNYAMVPGKKASVVFDPPFYKGIWEDYSSVCCDCPPTERQEDLARIYMVYSRWKDTVHYQHWTANWDVTYEQMVGDEMYGGING